MPASPIADLLERGLALHRRGAMTEAAAHYAEVLRADPANADAHYYLAMIACHAGRFAEGAELARKALAADPQYVRAHSLLGRALTALGQHHEALASFERAIALAPELAEAHGNRADVLSELGRYAEAIDSYDRALALAPDVVEDWFNRGAASSAVGRHTEAISNFDRVIAAKPGFAPAHLSRAKALFALGRREEALTGADEALAIDPNLAEAWLGRGNCLNDLKLFDQAFAVYDTALKLSPDLSYAAGARLYAKLHLCDWANLETETAQIVTAVRDGMPASEPFVFLAVPSSAADQLRCARLYVQEQPVFPPVWSGEVYSHDRIRVAYLSGDFHDHATAALTAGLFEQHDKSRFDITGISFGPDDNSAVRQRLQRAFPRFIDVQRDSDQEIADLIRRLEIDIVVDLKGFTADSRFDVLARRAAPVQVNYLGYPGTMAADHIDYILADPTVIPDEHCGFYTEQVVWLPGCYQINDDKRPIAESVPTRRECGLPDRGFVYCCFNNTYKISPGMFDIWMRLLKKTDNSVLWLFEGSSPSATNLCRDNLRREAKNRGVASARLVFAGRVNVQDHLARHRLADLFLDTLPYNAHTTASDALWAGLPVLTCLGETFAGRVAASLLQAVGLAELVTHSLEEYEALACRLALDAPYLASVKATLARQRHSASLFDTKRVTRQIEAAYTTMWQRYQAGQKPKAGSATAKPIRVA
jgi:predicted O-linked N-acetylglucosamine transferase (SPINDLY family)